MTVYPHAIDDDRTILRIDDNLSELGTAAINQLRSAVFAIEKELGLTPSGSKSTLDDRISVSLNEDGTLRSAAIEAAGLVSLPIVDAHVANNAGIREFKLSLDVGTLNLQAQINALQVLVNNTADLAIETNTDLLGHIGGVALLSDGSTPGRHVASHIDLNSVPTDSRDASYGPWSGLLDKDGALRSADNVNDALLQINDALTTHENLTAGAHPATAITVYADDWNEIPTDSENVQEVLDFFDNQETISTGVDRATLNSNGIPRNARVERIDLDGYNYEVIPETQVRAYLAEPSQTTFRDSISNGDDVISFIPEDNSDYSFDSLFTKVRVGDIVRINYGDGISGMFRVSSIRFTPGSEWVIRIDGFNLVNRDGDTDGFAYARIDRRRHDINTQGVLAVAASHADVIPDGACANALDGVIIGSPRGAMALGVGFDVGAFNGDHYNLWLRLYPNGDPEVFVDLPSIDVTGNFGNTQGAYSLDKIVESTNRAFRAAGYNYRFIAFQHDGEFGIMLADSWNRASFSIITGEANGTTIDEGAYTRNVVGDATDGYDALGFGASRAAVASPVNSGFTSSLEATNLSTLIHTPTRGRDYISDGARRDFLRTKGDTLGDGYWEAYVLSTFTDSPNGTITSTYRIDELLYEEEIKPGKSLVVQPVDPENININGYGRFIIGDVIYHEADGYTDILVINACHATSDPLGYVLPEDTEVLIYFTEDSVGFNFHNLYGQGSYHRYHEIYVDSAARTHAVERARMEKQSDDPAKLNTNLNNWQIRNVSPKMRGYRIDNELRYWLRFYILSYDSTTGEFDGYIGEPSPSTTTILNPGPVTHGHKNRSVRFYDESYVNFIDIEFRELAVDPGTTIAANPPQYIDIEIFPSFSTNDEEFRLAGVSHNETIVGSITDLREFGTLSEENFTDSAISFIEAGERYLHTNGVIRGFEYTGTGVNEAVLTFTGGMGLVNGSFVMTDALSCTIPPVRDELLTLDFLICLTQDGTLQAIPLQGTQFFDTSTGEFIESFTFADIVDNHKELLILYIANVTIGSLTLNSINDARRFAQNESTNGFSLAVAREDDPPPNDASFHSIEAMNVWVGLYGVNEIVAKEVNLEDFEDIYQFGISWQKPFTIRGGTWNVEKALTVSDGAVIKDAIINITTVGGVALSNAEIESCSITFNPVETPSYVANDLINSGEGFAMFVNSYSRIRNCTFTSSADQRPPFIVYSQTGGSTINGVRIQDNKFIDLGAATDNSAICFDATSESIYAYNIFIERNICNGTQNIVMAPRDAAAFGFKCSNVHIKDNVCGVIGFVSVGRKDFLEEQFGIEIDGNTCNLIANLQTEYIDSTDRHGYEPTVTTGHVMITNNTVRGIIWSIQFGSNFGPATTHIENNTVYCILNSVVSSYLGSRSTGWYSDVFAGIDIDMITPTGTDNVWTYVVGNTVYLIDTSTADVRAIRVKGNANVVNNYISIETSGVDVSDFILANKSYGDGHDSVLIQGNNLHRNERPIVHYINASSVEKCSIVDNMLHSHLVDDADTGSWTAAIDYGNDTFVANNKNHRICRIIHPSSGAHSTGPFTATRVESRTIESPVDGSVVNTTTNMTIFDQDSDEKDFLLNNYGGDEPGEVYFHWTIPLLSVLPNTVKIIEIKVTYTVNSSQPVSGNDSLLSVKLRSLALTTSPYNISDSLAYNDAAGNITLGEGFVGGGGSLDWPINGLFVRDDLAPVLYIRTRIEDYDAITVRSEIIEKVEITYQY